MPECSLPPKGSGNLQVLAVGQYGKDQVQIPLKVYLLCNHVGLGRVIQFIDGQFNTLDRMGLSLWQFTSGRGSYLARTQ